MVFKNHKLTEYSLINAIGAGERISLSKLAISHLQRTARPIRVAVDISIWLFQVQSGRGGKNPELRTLFFRLLKLLALPIHPLFVYDGRHKPPFKRGKSVSYGSTPLIRRSKDLIERFRFPWHEAPGEAEAECARLQQAGVVDAVMSNDVDALMFGSRMTIMNFSKESGTGTTAATHVTCYCMDGQAPDQTSCVPLDRAGMILFAMLSGGDYAEGVKGCGSKLAAEIAQAGFGQDLLETLSSHPSDLDSGLKDWRERLQYELDENESGYFKRKHKAVQIPADFPDQTILTYYAEPTVSTSEGMTFLKEELRHAWDREIDPLAIRTFAADNFEWNYRSGARKIIKLLAEPLLSYRLRLQRPVIGVRVGSLAPECDTPWLQTVYRSRASFGTDGTTELQMDMLPIDVVGIDLLAEEPNPPMPLEEAPTQSTTQSAPDEAGAEEEDPEDTAEAPPPSPSKTRITKRYDPFTIEKVWIFETVAKLGIPDVVQKWDKDQAEKAEKANKKPSKGPAKRRTGPKKKGPIDPGMKRGSILKYGTLTKESSELSTSNKGYLVDTMNSKSQREGTSSSPNQAHVPGIIDLDSYQLSPSMYPERESCYHQPYDGHEVDELTNSFSSLSTTAQMRSVKRHPMSIRSRPQLSSRILSTGECDFQEPTAICEDVVSSQILSSRVKLSYVVSRRDAEQSLEEASSQGLRVPPASPKPKKKGSFAKKQQQQQPNTPEASDGVGELGEAIKLLSVSLKPDSDFCTPKSRRPCEPTLPNDDGIEAGQCTPVAKQIEQLEETHCVDTSKSATQKKIEAKCRSPSKSSKKDMVPNPTIGYAENVSTFNGFWETHEETESEAPGKKGHKKLLSRVSILDLV